MWLLGLRGFVGEWQAPWHGKKIDETVHVHIYHVIADVNYDDVGKARLIAAIHVKVLCDI